MMPMAKKMITAFRLFIMFGIKDDAKCADDEVNPNRDGDIYRDPDGGGRYCHAHARLDALPKNREDGLGNCGDGVWCDLQ